MFEGLTTGTPSCDGIFILRNPENCNIMDYALKGIPIYMEKKLKANYEICMDFWELPKRKEVKEYLAGEPIQVKDFTLTSFILNPSNMNTHIIRVTDKKGKSVVVCGDFRNYDSPYGQDKFREAISKISKTDCLVIEGKYLGKKRF